MKSIIVVFCLIVVYNCNSQIIGSKDVNKTDNMEYFDMNKYKNLKQNPKYLGQGNYLDQNGDEVRIMGNLNSEPIVEIKKNNSPYRIQKQFYKNTSLKIETKYFYGTIVETVKEYDEKGKLIKETDYDKDYKFSIEDLTKKMKQEYKVDILNTRQTRSVNRNNNEYLVICDQQARNTFYNYVIDGTTGETLSIKIIDAESEYEKVILDLKAEKKKTEEDDNIYFTTYKGKDYTKGEWKAFEEEWYKNHQDKKNSKGFGDDIFKRP